MKRWAFALVGLLGLLGCQDEAPQAAPTSPPSAPQAPAPAPTASKGRLAFTARSPKALALTQKARELLINHSDDPGARAMLREAIALDPELAIARAYLADATPGAEGDAEMAHALSLAGKLPASEQTYVALLAARHRGDPAEVQRLGEALRELAPGDDRVHAEVGNDALNARRWNEAIAAYKASLALVPSDLAYNNLGYALLMAGDLPGAINALQNYVALAPQAPNAYDSLGEVELLAGHYEEAEKNFKTAAKVAPKFWPAWQGLAQTRFLHGDWKGGAEALESGKQAAVALADQLVLAENGAWALLAQGHGDKALAQLAALEKQAAPNPRKPVEPYVFVEAAMLRSMFELELGHAAAAAKSADAAQARLESSGLTGAMRATLLHRIRLRKLLAEARVPDVHAAEAQLQQLEQGAQQSPSGEIQAALFLARGAVAQAKGNTAAALAAFGHCDIRAEADWTIDYRYKPEDAYCLGRWVQLAEAHGEHAEAEKARAALIQGERRDPVYLYVRDQLARAKR